jgi:hypothetical protein
MTSNFATSAVGNWAQGIGRAVTLIIFGKSSLQDIAASAPMYVRRTGMIPRDPKRIPEVLRLIEQVCNTGCPGPGRLNTYIGVVGRGRPSP